ncbi:YefM protein (antitoxin to YoeB) [Georgfuchsia toluolica]|uniref:Antitoxin n=1 Tax=Georgfuchsia toluolica TaxID=424218 RepID=A0A916J4R8_9PROT|nr:type II toxin-antitoxin system Phd/YefM family antitoxin [Georgfuchsia toluolica]CAG4883880.1 YefM protein (antitoxin to YoeB) [Georgfuchsia toluolica]
MRFLQYSEARNNLKRVIDQAVSDADVSVITRRDAPGAVVMSLDTYNSLLETIELLKVQVNAAYLIRPSGQPRQSKVKLRDLLET